MENNPTTDNTSAPASRPNQVMDVQPPTAVPAPPPEIVESINQTDAQAEPTVPEAAPTATEAPAAAPVEATTPDTDKPSPLAAEQPAHPEHHTPIIAISAALVIAVLLAVAAVFAYKYSQPDTNSSKSPTTTQQSSVSAQDVDDTNKQIDDSLATTNDDTDFNGTDLNDTTLAL